MAHNDDKEQMPNTGKLEVKLSVESNSMECKAYVRILHILILKYLVHIIFSSYVFHFSLC